MTSSLEALVITHAYQAAPERVYEAWVDPMAVGEWMSGPMPSGVVSVPSHFEVDERVGGRFSFVVVRDAVPYEHSGEYLRVAPAKQLDFTWGLPAFSADVSTVRLRFEAEGEGCRLVLTHEGVAPEFIERCRAGWAHLLEAIAKQLGERP